MVQNHFAVTNNIGAVSAKEEVWEVVGQLAGYAFSLLLLDALQKSGEAQHLLASMPAGGSTACSTREPALCSPAP